MEIDFRLYLPEAIASRVQIRGSFTGNRWKEMESPGPDGLWNFEANSVRAGQYYEFRYLDRSGEWQLTTDPLAYRSRQAV